MNNSINNNNVNDTEATDAEDIEGRNWLGTTVHALSVAGNATLDAEISINGLGRLSKRGATNTYSAIKSVPSLKGKLPKTNPLKGKVNIARFKRAEKHTPNSETITVEGDISFS